MKICLCGEILKATCIIQLDFDERLIPQLAFSMLESGGVHLIKTKFVFISYVLTFDFQLDAHSRQAEYYDFCEITDNLDKFVCYN